MASVNPELLVTKGLFPENLPPVYTAKDIWPALPRVTTYSVTSKAVGDPCVYNASKRGGQRRLFGIPHPLFIKDQGFFFQLVNRKVQRGVIMMTPRLEALAGYVANLLRIRDELSDAANPELRTELDAAITAFQKELRDAQGRRAGQ